MPVILQLMLTCFGLLTFLGTAVVYLRGSQDKGTIETLQRNNDALTDRVGILEAEDERKGNQIKALEIANEVLTSTANSSAEIADLRNAFLERLESHHVQAMGGMGQLHTDLTRLTAAVNNLGGTS